MVGILHVSEMASELLYKAVVLKLILPLLLSDFSPHCEATSFIDFATIEPKVACDGQRLNVHCVNASLGLRIYSAFYGRTEPGRVLCPYKGQNNDKEFKCGESDVTVRFKDLCGRRNKCRVKINAGLFGDPCPQKKHKHLYLTFVYACQPYRRLSTETTPTSILSAPNSSLVRTTPTSILSAPNSSLVRTTPTSILSAPNSSLVKTTPTSILSAPNSSLVSSSSLSVAMSPTATSPSFFSSIPQIKSTPTIENVPTIVTANTKEVTIIIDTSYVGKVGSSSDINARSLGITGALFVWLLFVQDHGSDYITVFFASAAGALALAIIVGIFIYYRHKENKQHLHVKELPKVHAYGTVERKMLPEVDSLISGPVKTPPPDYMIDGYNYNWQRGGTSLQKKSANGTVVGTFSPKDLPTKDMNGERQNETLRYQRNPYSPATPRRYDSSKRYMGSEYPSNRSLRIERERATNFSARRSRTGDSRPSSEAFYY